ncbi:MAG TPA: peptidoglycan DD-metalloendopeptidase family protein [Candidatus Eisenbergiella merdipullorum]|uniref:Peptidoglycan DD-metalloendopeptidase family protein n=1 Tax=Candidatus Eisenbergiella merdipullorum TaxID=2838553 RepID=A0A9D2I4J3_9FIRM|nr:peptidoglycan DD-metalloendopeptidase family protein [Candidatus Eisenbergiella merdipullorum]
MRRRRSSFRKEKAIMLVSSCLVLAAMTVTGLYVRNLGEEEPEDNVVDFTALEDGEEDAQEDLTMLGSMAEDRAMAEERAMAEDRAMAEEQASNDQAVADGQAAADGQAVAENQAAADAQAAADGGSLTDGGQNAGEAVLAEKNSPNEEQNGGTGQGDGEKEEDTDASDGTDEEALAANASDAIVKSENAGEEDEDAMSASSFLDFSDSDTLVWPIVGNVLVNYSMDKTVYFATLDQYKYSPAIVISATEGEEITAAADGQVTSIYHDPEIGTAVVMNLGDGYELTYGQLTDLSVAEGDMVTTGELIGKVAAPTMYYSVEGTNVYFKLTKDGVPVDPMSRLG